MAKSFVMTGMKKLAFDAANKIKRTDYTQEELDDAIRKSIVDACGGEWSPTQFMKNYWDVFAIMIETFPVAMHANLADGLDRFAEFHDTALGDRDYFRVNDQQTYPVLTVATGTKDLIRNRITDRKFYVPTINKGIKFYAELDEFIRGKMDFARLNETAAKAMSNYVGELIADAIYDSYSSVGTDFKTEGAFDPATFLGIAQEVRKATNSKRLQVFGDVTALANIADGFGYSDSSKDIANELGFYDRFRGMDLIALPNAYSAGTTDAAIDTDHVIILPADEKIVKVIFEGDAWIKMDDGMSRNDLQPEITFTRRIGAAAITTPAGKYGFYKFT
jgi:hypothetical protein